MALILGLVFTSVCRQTDEERRISLNSIGPVWDGNEVCWYWAAGRCLPPSPGLCFALLWFLYCHDAGFGGADHAYRGD